MAKKLLVVHPSGHYDIGELTRAAIIAVARAYAPENTYLVVNDEKHKEYLGREDFPHKLDSKHGNIHTDRTEGKQFLDDLLKDCEHLTVIGHTGGTCHHTSFEDVVKYYAESGYSALEIKIPTYAVSRISEDSSGEPIRNEILEIEANIADEIKVPPKLRPYVDHLATGLTKREIATLIIMYQYVNTCLAQSHKLDFEVVVDDRTVFTYNTGKSKRLKLVLEN